MFTKFFSSLTLEKDIFADADYSNKVWGLYDAEH